MRREIRQMKPNLTIHEHSQSNMKPQYLNKWTRPCCYVGAEWPDCYVFLGRTRDSDALERANFDAALQAVGGEQTGKVNVVRASHWAVGWVEWIAIHESATEALKIADEIKGRLENYPVVSEELLSQYESDEADEVWRDCYRPKERIQYIRNHPSQFDFRDLSDMLACVRGRYFAGHAGELLN
jgi:hypothetical protein